MPQANVNLVVDESGAVQGLTRFQQRAMASLDAARREAQKTSSAVDEISAAATRAGNSMSTGFQRANGHALTNLDTVRLLRDDLGVRIPRAMEKLISQSQAFQSVASAAFGALAGIGVVQILAHAGEQVYDLYEKYISLTAASKDYNKTTQQRADMRFVDTHSIETTRDNLRLANDEAKGLIESGEKLQSFSGFMDRVNNVRQPTDLASIFGDIREGRVETDQGYKMQGQADDLAWRLPEQQTQINKLNIEAQHAADGQLGAQQKINAELQKTLALNKEGAAYRRIMDGKPVGDNPSDEESLKEDEIARKKAAADLVNLNEETERALRRMRDETNALGLKGIDELYAQEKTQIDSLSEKDAAYAAKKVAIHEQTKQKVLVLIQEEADKTAEIEAKAADAGLTGNAKILADEKRTMDAIDLLYAKSEISWTDMLRREEAAHKTSMSEIKRNMDDYSKSSRETSDAMAIDSAKGYARIAAERKKAESEAADKYHAQADGLPSDDYDDQLQAYSNYLDNMEAIRRRSDAQQKDLHDKNQQETDDIGFQTQGVRSGARGRGIGGILSEEQDATAKINAEYRKRSEALKEAEQQNLVTHQEYLDRQAQLDQLYDAQIQEAQSNMRSKIANMLESGFKDPMGAIKNVMKQQMEQILADWLMQMSIFKRVAGSTMQGGPRGRGGLLGAVIGSTGTASQSSVAPGASSTAFGSEQDASDSTAGGSITGGGGFGANMLGAGPIVSAGLSALGIGKSTGTSVPNVGGVSGASSPATSTGSWNDADIGSEQDASAVDSTGGTMAQQGTVGGVAGGSMTALNIFGAGVGAYTGAKGVIGAFEGGKASDILSGAASGATLGASVGMLAGPLGAAIGGAIGAVGGATAGLVGWASGEGNRLGAAKYFKSTTRPEMEQELTSYTKGGGDATSTISSVDATAQQSYLYMAKQFGSSAAQWAKAAYIDKEQQAIERQINQMALGGRDYTSRSAAQFHSGGTIDGFGDLATSDNEGFIHAMLGESIVNPVASATHSSAINAMNAGASPSDIAGMYMRNMMSPAAPPSGGDTHHHWSVQTVDGASFEQMLTRRGGMDAIARATNKRIAQYSGDAA